MTELKKIHISWCEVETLFSKKRCGHIIGDNLVDFYYITPKYKRRKKGHLLQQGKILFFFDKELCEY